MNLTSAPLNTVFADLRITDEYGFTRHTRVKVLVFEIEETGYSVISEVAEEYLNMTDPKKL